MKEPYSTMTATVFTYFHLCHRKMWLHYHHIQMEHSSDLVAEGKVIHESSYPKRSRRYRELQLPGVKLDHYDSGAGIVHEIKKSHKQTQAHIAQVKYYLWTLEQHGLPASHGILEYPRQKQRKEVWLTDLDREEIPECIMEIQKILGKVCPERLAKSACRKCSYFDFCWSEEEA